MAATVRITPRPRRTTTRPAPVELTYATVLALSEAGMRIDAAAARLGVCTTSFKRACRRLGLAQWGHYHTRGDASAFSRALALCPIHATPFPAAVCEGGGTVDDLLARLDPPRPPVVFFCV